jgi:hypothetical protein
MEDAMTDIETAEQIVRDLETKRQRLAERGVKLADDRRTIAYDAHADGDAEARNRLDKLNAEAVAHASELTSLDDAIATARERLVAAQQAVARGEDKAKAQQLRQAVAAFAAHGRDLDEALSSVGELGRAMRDDLSRIHDLGSTFPSHAQLDVLGYGALLTALGGTQWAHRFERLAPNQRRTFTALVATWAATVERGIAQRLGKDQKVEAA